jgi:hypothetical protein
MAHAFEIKQWDTLPLIEATLTKTSTGAPIDLTGATVAFFMRASGAASALPSVNPLIASIANASLAQVAVAWASGVHATASFFQAEFQINFGGGNVQTVPNRGYIPFAVYDDIG